MSATRSMISLGLAAAIATSALTTSFAASAAPISGAVSTHDFDLGVPILDFSCGLSYTPRWRNRQFQFTSGYVYEQWWYLGDTGLGNSNLGLTIQGLFFVVHWAINLAAEHRCRPPPGPGHLATRSAALS